jgi:hypothetical protein
MENNNGTPAVNVDRSTLKSWFVKFAKPTQSQFHAWIDAFWHKNEKIPMAQIEGLPTALANKAETAALQQYVPLSGTMEDKPITGKIISENDLEVQKITAEYAITTAINVRDEIFFGEAAGPGHARIGTLSESPSFPEGITDLVVSVDRGGFPMVLRSKEDLKNLIMKAHDENEVIPAGKLIPYVENNDVALLEHGDIYSTEEIVIGKWIEGSPIYRKVIEIEAFTGELIIDTSGLSISIFLKTEAVIFISAGHNNTELITEYYNSYRDETIGIIDEFFQSKGTVNSSNLIGGLTTSNVTLKYGLTKDDTATPDMNLEANGGYLIIEYVK